VPLRAGRGRRSWRRGLRQLLAELGQGVAVARGGRVRRQAEGLGDLREGQPAPDFQDEDFALLGRQGGDGRFEGGPAFVLFELRGEQRFGAFGPGGGGLAAGTAGLAAAPVEGVAADAGEQVGGRV